MEVRYYVSKSADRWTVRYDEKDYPYPSHSEAVLAAVKAASSASANGYEAEVSPNGQSHDIVSHSLSF